MIFKELILPLLLIILTSNQSSYAQNAQRALQRKKQLYYMSGMFYGENMCDGVLEKKLETQMEVLGYAEQQILASKYKLYYQNFQELNIQGRQDDTMVLAFNLGINETIDNNCKNEYLALP